MTPLTVVWPLIQQKDAPGGTAHGGADLFRAEAAQLGLRPRGTPRWKVMVDDCGQRWGRLKAICVDTIDGGTGP